MPTMTGYPVSRRTSRSQPSTRSRFLELPRELRDMVYDWVIILFHEGMLKNRLNHEMHRGMPTVSSVVTGEPGQTLGRACKQFSRELLHCAFKKCKVVGGFGHNGFELVWPQNSITTRHFHKVETYEIVMDADTYDYMDFNDIVRHAEVAIYCLPNLGELVLRYNFSEAAEIDTEDPDEARIVGPLMSFSPTNIGRLRRLRKIVTMGFWDFCTDEITRGHVFEYRDRTDRFNPRTGLLEESSNVTRDRGFWDFVNDLNENCRPYLDYLSVRETSSFNKVYEEIATRYNEWEKAGKPETKDSPYYKMCEALQDIESTFSAAEARKVVGSLWKNRKYIGY